MSEPLKVAIAGLGTVGGGTLKILTQNKNLLAERCGRAVEVVAVAERNKEVDHGVPMDGIEWLDDASKLPSYDNVDVIVELIGGSGGIAKSLVEQAIANGKHVVTANKALLAHHGAALGKAADEKGVTLGYEAAVAGVFRSSKPCEKGWPPTISAAFTAFSTVPATTS